MSPIMNPHPHGAAAARPNTIYKWADENLMLFNEGKFEWWAKEMQKKGKGMYKTKSGKLIEENKTVKDLGVPISLNQQMSHSLNTLMN